MKKKKKQMKIEKIDHLGLVAGVIKDLGLTKHMDSLLGTDDQEIVTAGEAVTAMIINGLGFTSQPLSLIPQFFETKALDRLIRDGVEPKHLNRFKLGRVLDKISDYGCEKFVSGVSLKAIMEEKVDLGFCSGDTTSMSLYGEYQSDIDVQPIKVTRGYSKDKRPDLKQVIVDLLTSQDGGIPVTLRVWSGNESDTQILKERVKSFIKMFKDSSELRCLIADSKLYNKKGSSYLKQINFITRIPATIKLENECVDRAISDNEGWEKIDEKNKIKVFPLMHYGMNQRWIIIHSNAAHERALKSVNKSVDKEKEAIEKKLSKLSKQRFACKKDAVAALGVVKKSFVYHQIQNITINEHKVYGKAGRPRSGKGMKIEYQVEATFVSIPSVIHKKIDQKSCFVVGTNIPERFLSADKVVVSYKKQDCVEKGFAFLKSPEFFVSSFYVKNISRIEGLMAIMVLSLLVYSIAQRRLRMQLRKHNMTIPNQIKQPTKNPTMRWIFQLFEGIYFVTIEAEDIAKRSIEGLNELRTDVIKLLGAAVKDIYGVV